MWQSTHSVVTDKVTKEQVWALWSDMSKRPLWDTDTEWARIEGPFQNGSMIHFKVKDGPEVRMQLVDCVPMRTFTDCTRFPLARMYGIHEMEETGAGLRLSVTFRMEGPLAFLWRKLVAEKVAAHSPEQTASLIEVAAQRSDG